MNPRKPFRSSSTDATRINHRIRAREVRVIGADGSQLGVMETRKALELAQSLGLDLAEISATSNPPVCKILDYGKHKYETKKKAKESKKNQTVVQMKEVQFRPQTDVHDVEFKVKHILRFLAEGNKVRLSVRFRGREASHAEIGHQLLKQVIDLIGPLGMVEANPRLEGRILSLLVAPNSKGGGAKKPALKPAMKPAMNPALAPKAASPKPSGPEVVRVDRGVPPKESPPKSE